MSLHVTVIHLSNGLSSVIHSDNKQQIPTIGGRPLKGKRFEVMCHVRALESVGKIIVDKELVQDANAFVHYRRGARDGLACQSRL